jgi:hypothetical protein
VQSEVRRGNSHRIFFFSLLELVAILVLKITFTCSSRKVDIVFNMTSTVMESIPMRVGCKIICAVSRFTYIYVHIEDRKIAPIVLLLYFLKSFYLPLTRNMYFIYFTFFLQ